MTTSVTAAPPRGGAGPRVRAGAALVLAGAALLVVSVVLPQTTPFGGSLGREGTGWPVLVLAGLAAWLTVRAARRGRASWSGLWVGGVAVLDALAIAREAGYGAHAGAAALGLGGVIVLAGWALGFAAARPEVAGLGPWAGLAGRVRTARPAAAGARPAAGARALLWPLGLYALLAVVFWAVPVLGRLGSTLIAQNDVDPSVYTWFYGWWPHAVLHGLNPFITHAIFAPEGYNLTWVTAVPGPSLLVAPVTLAFGPVVAYNFIAVASPALAAWTAFLLCRELTGRTGPSVLGGYLFGFSPYILRMLQGSPDLYLVALVPLLALVVLRHLGGRLGDRGLVALVAVLVAAQFYTCLEVMVTATIFGALALIGAFVLLVERRATLIRTAGLLVLGYVGAAVLISPVVVVMLTHSHTTPDHNTPLLAGSLLSWVTPDPAVVLATTHDVTGAPGWYGGPGAFGIPLLLAVGAFAWTRRREPVARLAALCFAVPAVLSLGPLLILSVRATHVGLPWALPAHLPGVHTLIPQRFTMYAFLAAGVIVAVWLSTPSPRPAPRVRWALAALAVASMVPWIGSVAWDTPAADPPFFADGGAAARELHPTDRVLAIPLIGRSMRWQSHRKFGFALTGGGVGAFPEDLRHQPIFSTLISGQLTPGWPGQIRRFVRQRGVTAIVVQDGASPAYRRLFAALGVAPRHVGGVLYYRLRPAPETAAAGADRGAPPRRVVLKRSSGRSTT